MANQRFAILQARAVSDKRITHSQFRTLAALGMYGDKNGWCYPKLQTLADSLGKTRQAVSSDLQQLETLGYVQIQKQYREDGSQKSNLYRLIFDTNDGGGQADIDGGQAAAEGGSSSEVDGGSSSEVDPLTIHINDPINDIKNNNKDPEKTFKKIARTYEQEIGPLTGMIADDITACLEEYPPEWFEMAMREAALASARNWKYVKAILANWKAHGVGWKPKNKKPGEKNERLIGKLMN